MLLVPQVPSGNDMAAEASDSEWAARKIKTMEVLTVISLQVLVRKNSSRDAGVGRDVAYLPSVTRKGSLCSVHFCSERTLGLESAAPKRRSLSAFRFQKRPNCSPRYHPTMTSRFSLKPCSTPRTPCGSVLLPLSYTSFLKPPNNFRERILLPDSGSYSACIPAL